MTQPYYQDDNVTLYHADCRDVMIPSSDVDLLLTDPPYGINIRTDNYSRKRSAVAQANDYHRVYGDDKPFDPQHLLGYKQIVLFGANNFAAKLPPSSAWLVWDKLNGLSGKRTIGFNDSADCELAWTNFENVSRIFRHRWMGLMKESENGQRRVHPTQKPIRLMQRIIEWRTEPGDTVYDPYAGSGSTIIGALMAECKVIACEIVEGYCEVIVQRLQSYYQNGLEESERPTPRPKLVLPS